MMQETNLLTHLKVNIYNQTIQEAAVAGIFPCKGENGMFGTTLFWAFHPD